MNQDLRLEATDVSKVFNRRKIFSDITLRLQEGGSLAITGRNGSGKSTLIKILAGVLSPTRGSVSMEAGGRSVSPADRFRHLGFVSPYLQLYDEFTGWENLDIFRRIRGVDAPDRDLEGLLERFRLGDRRDDLVRTYSSGMKQRLKYAFALLHKPPVLLLDEPTSNLDAEGIQTVHEVMEEQKRSGGILVVATNDREDQRFCHGVMSLDAEGRGR